MRTLIARCIAPVMRATGYRFDKSFRQGRTVAHRIIYRCVDVVAANVAADHE